MYMYVVYHSIDALCTLNRCSCLCTCRCRKYDIGLYDNDSLAFVNCAWHVCYIYYRLSYSDDLFYMHILSRNYYFNPFRATCRDLECYGSSEFKFNDSRFTFLIKI